MGDTGPKYHSLVATPKGGKINAHFPHEGAGWALVALGATAHIDVYLNTKKTTVLVRYSADASRYACYEIGATTVDAAENTMTLAAFAPSPTLNSDAYCTLEVIRRRMPSVFYNMFVKAWPQEQEQPRDGQFME